MHLKWERKIIYLDARASASVLFTLLMVLPLLTIERQNGNPLGSRYHPGAANFVGPVKPNQCRSRRFIIVFVTDLAPLLSASASGSGRLRRASTRRPATPPCSLLGVGALADRPSPCSPTGAGSCASSST
jgi:hypothetical protein